MRDSDDGVVERATELRNRALSDPAAIDLEELEEILSNPVAPPAAHGAALVALSNVARVRDDVGEAFVADLGRLLGRPSLDTALVLRCLRQLATNDPEAVLELRDEIGDRISIDNGDGSENATITQAATGCCVELAAAEPMAFVDLVPTLAALLDEENEHVRTNAVYVLSQIAHEYPEEVKPIVPQLIAGIESRDQTYQTNALSALGAVVDAYPAAGTAMTDRLAAIAGSKADPEVRANAVGLLGDIAAEHPTELEGHVPVLVDCLRSGDEYVAGNAAAALLHVAINDVDAAEDAIPALIALLDDPSPPVRRNACKVLGHLEAAAALDRLTQIAESDSEESVRRVAVWAVERVS